MGTMEIGGKKDIGFLILKFSEMLVVTTDVNSNSQAT